ncbi:toxin biosynthesis ketoreductase [Aspergillus granulosus]|uniref:Toxin biosynthesis ketoreductase n=1 Tax=Aspergillus granulosus TaxID=176169 RepID=A0ABR4GX06_9EURO
MSQVVLVTGASRGIGRGLVTHYLARPNTTVIGTVRDTTSANAKQLDSLQKADGSRLILATYVVDSPTSAAEAVSEIQTRHGISHLDLVIANAGICDHWGPVSEATDADVVSHFEVNTLGLLRLFRAVAPLLQNAPTPKFVYISTFLASIGSIGQLPSLTGPYGMSKAAGNFMIKKIHAENEHLITLSIDPGLVQTDLGDRAAQFYGLEKAPVTLEQSVRGITTQIDKVDKSTSGSFVNAQGENVAW